MGRNKALTIHATPERWNNRSALRLTNGTMEAVLLRGGGQIAELRLAGDDESGVNCLWAAPWETADPGEAGFSKLAESYGGGAVGQFLAGYTGHALCLDVFGAPSTLEAALGVGLHGEASARTWSFEPTARGCVCRVGLPIAGLGFQRTISLAAKSSVLCVDEQVENRGEAEREIHWVQHVSLGPPLLQSSRSCVHASLDRAMPWPRGYEGHELLGSSAFEWPTATSAEGAPLNLEDPFWRRGFGFIAAARVRVDEEIGWIAALNWQLGLALVYCFRRADFPWVAVWEENSARAGAPWNSAAQVRGMMFGTTPMPLGKEGVEKMGKLFGTAGSRMIGEGAVLRARYLVCIARVPTSWRGISSVIVGQRSLKLMGQREAEAVTVGANGLLGFLKGREKEK